MNDELPITNEKTSGLSFVLCNFQPVNAALAATIEYYLIRHSSFVTRHFFLVWFTTAWIA